MKRWTRDLSIRTHLVVLALVVLVPAGALVAWTLENEARHAEEAARVRVDILAAGTADDLRRIVTHARAELSVLTRRPALQQLDGPRCDAFLGDYIALNRDYGALMVLDPRGDVVCAYPATPETQALAGAMRGDRTGTRTDAFSVGEAFKPPGSARWFVTVGLAIRNDDRVQLGELVVAFDLQQLNDELFGGVPPNALVSVIDGSRAVMLRSSEPATYRGTRQAAGAPNPFVSRRDGFAVATGRDGVARLFALRSVPLTNWQVVAGLPEEDVMADARAARARTGALLALVSLSAVGLIALISSAIVRPINALTRTAARVAGGDLAARASLHGPPELRSVAHQFNEMLEARALSEAKIRGIIESAVDAIITANGEQVIVQANSAAATMFGTTIDDMLGSPLERFIPAGKRADHRAAVEGFGAGSVTARHMGASREVQALRADGSEFPIEASISRITVNGQRLYTVIHRDITERKRAQAELTEGKAKLEAALASMNDAVFIADTQGRFQDVNDAFVRFLRFKDKASCPRDLAESADLLEITMADGSPAPVDLWAVPRALRGESGSGVEYGVRRRDTGEHWTGSYSFAPIRAADGSIVGAVVVARDVTSAKEVQADLAASHAALQRLIAAQDRVQEDERARIARELHDDLQQILAAVRIDLGELSERLAVAGSGELPLVREVDALANRAIVSTRRIVDDLRPQMIEDLGLVPALQSLAAQFARRTGIACEMDAAEDLSETLKARPALATCLFRVAQEALNNVAKHARATRVDVRLAALASGQVALSVVDDGQGIRNADRRKPESFGMLGMNERVRAQGGALRVERLAQGGTLVEVLVPTGGAPAAPARGEGPGEAPSAIADALPVPRLLGHTARQTLQAVIDAMACNIAVVDADGFVRFVNRAWIAFAEHNGNPGSREMGPGVNYLEVCRRCAGEDGHAAAVLQGLGDVLAGRAADFTVEYPCHSDDEWRWYRMHATPMASGDVLVMHVLVESRPRTAGDPGFEPTQRTPAPS